MFWIVNLYCQKIVNAKRFSCMGRARRHKESPAGAGPVGADTGTIVITDAEGRSYSWKSAVRSGIHTKLSE